MEWNLSYVAKNWNFSWNPFHDNILSSSNWFVKWAKKQVEKHFLEYTKFENCILSTKHGIMRQKNWKTHISTPLQFISSTLGQLHSWNSYNSSTSQTLSCNSICLSFELQNALPQSLMLISLGKVREKVSNLMRLSLYGVIPKVKLQITINCSKMDEPIANRIHPAEPLAFCS